MSASFRKLRQHTCGVIILLLVSALQLPANLSPDQYQWYRILVLWFGDKNDCSRECAEECPKEGCPPELDFGFLDQSQLVFEPNLGQSRSTGGFVAQNGALEFHLTASGAKVSVLGDTIEARYLDASAAAQPEPLDPRETHVNYLLGNRPERWITDVPTFGRIRYPGIYPGIDVVYHGRGALLEHDFEVSPGADPSRIRVQFKGAETMKVADDGSLELAVHGKTILWKSPEVYQVRENGSRRAIRGRYRVVGAQAGFDIGEYDRRLPLVIDPVVVYATYYGRGGAETAARVATDSAGNVYYTGVTTDLAYPRTGGALQGTPLTGDANVILNKIAADGKTVLYTTHFGGSGMDGGTGIALDAAGNIYLTGITNSEDFPLTRQVQSPAPAIEDGNCFVSKLNPAGNALVYSTLLGGSRIDLCASIAIDGTGSAWVAGSTASRDYPLQNPVQSRVSNATDLNIDAVVSKLSPDGGSLLFSTYLGGGGNEGVVALALDASGNAYLTGATTSSDFPASTGALQTRFGGRGGTGLETIFDTGDAFAAKLNSSGALQYATYLGGTRDDAGFGIAVDSQGNAYIAGNTLSSNFPTKTPLQAAYGGTGGERRFAAGDAFVAKLNSQGSDLVYSTYLGSRNDDRAMGIAVDATGNAYITGNTLSPAFPVTTDAAQSANKGQRDDARRPIDAQFGDAFLAQLGPAGNLVYSSFLGGTGADWGIGITLDSTGGVIVAGGTNSTDFPTTASVVQSTFGGANLGVRPGGDAFVVRYGAAAPTLAITSVESAASYATTAVAPGEIVILKGIGIGPDQLTGLQLDSTGVTKTLAGTRILFDDTPAPIVYAWKSQSSAIVPYNVAGRSSTRVVVEYNGTRSAAVSVPVTTAVPGLFSADASGRGQGAILNQDNSYNSAQNPAAKGSVIQLFGTGEGATDPAGVDGRIASSIFPKPTLPVSVLIGGTRIITLPYYGAAPSAVAGLFQINLPVPTDAPSGNVPVVVSIGGVDSQGGLTVAVR